jgi:hypothetical protein
MVYVELKVPIQKKKKKKKKSWMKSRCQQHLNLQLRHKKESTKQNLKLENHCHAMRCMLFLKKKVKKQRKHSKTGDIS